MLTQTGLLTHFLLLRPAGLGEQPAPALRTVTLPVSLQSRREAAPPRALGQPPAATGGGGRASQGLFLRRGRKPRSRPFLGFSDWEDVVKLATLEVSRKLPVVG